MAASSSRFFSGCSIMSVLAGGRPKLLLYRDSHTLHNATVRLKSSDARSTRGNPISKYFRSLKWVWIPTGLGLAYVSYQQLGHVIKRERRKIGEAPDGLSGLATEKQVNLYRRMPLKAISRAWGKFNSLEVPVWLRKPAYKLYIWMFDCKLEEAAIEDLKHYRNLGEFFRRQLKPSVRPVDFKHSVTSPSDGKVLHFGRITKGHVEQVKGVTYSLQGFLGPCSPTDNSNKVANNNNKDTQVQVNNSDDASTFLEELKLNKDTPSCLYHCIIYLAPGDYHRFHSPVNWSVKFRRHFPGELFSVNPGVARWIQGLFSFNERAVYMGKWQHGFFSMTAVGATNVGSIRTYFDKELITNDKAHKHSPPGTFFDKSFTSNNNIPGIDLTKGESFGEFNLGSTIVLIFEAPENFDFKIESGQKIKFGEPLGCYKNL